MDRPSARSSRVRSLEISPSRAALTRVVHAEDEWRGFEYAHDIEFFDIFCESGHPQAESLKDFSPHSPLRAAFGQSAQAAVGKGWVQEWLARTLNQPLSEFNSTTNSTLHTSRYFPLDQNIYVDATHDTSV